MNCESVRERISLYCYGELSSEQDEKLRDHLAGCADCRRDWEREKRMLAALNEAELRPPAELLVRCRADLAFALQGAAGGRRRLLQPRSWFGGRSGAWLWQGAGAVAMLAIGFLAARFTLPAGGGTELGAARQAPVSKRVRYVESAGPGRVRITFDEMRRRELSGSLNDDAVQKLLLSALQSPADPGLRAESADLLKNRSGSTDVRRALLSALEKDPNDGVRLKALEGLRPYAAAPETRRALSRVLLTDRNPGIRSMAVDLLIQSQTPDVVETLQDLLQTERNGYIRNRTRQALRAMRASVETF